METNPVTPLDKDIRVAALEHSLKKLPVVRQELFMEGLESETLLEEGETFDDEN